MTIIATAPFYQAGALVAAGPAELNYAADVEADLVRRGVASYVGGGPQDSGRGRSLVEISENPTTGQLERWDAASGAYVGVGGVGLTETLPGSGIYLAEVANKVDTAANLRLYAGADGQISAASDVNALFRHTGVAGAIGDYRNALVGRAVLTLAAQTRATGSALDFAGGTATYDPLGVISIAGDSITIPAGIDYYDVSFYLPISERSGATNTQRKIAMLIGGATPSPYQLTGLTDITLTDVHSGQIMGDMKHITKTKALTNVLTFIFTHNSAVNPDIGGPATLPRITIDMYRND